MRRRIALGAAVLAVGGVGAALVLRANGYLGGRDPDGPLEGSVGGASGSPRERAGAFGWNDLLLTNSGEDPVELESVEVDGPSPGVGFLGARVWERGERDILSPEAEAAFPVRLADPGRLRAIPGTRIPPGDTPVAITTGLHLPGRGRWYADGLRVRYRQGARHFDEAFRGPIALCVGMRPRVHCLPPRAPPRPDDGLVIYGGAQDFGPRARNGEGGLYDEDEVVLYFREHHPVAVAVTLLNAGDDDVEIRGLRFFPPPVGEPPRTLAVSQGVDVQADRDRYAPRGPLEPLRPFTVPAGEGRLVRLRGRFTSCDQVRPGMGLGSPMVALTADGEEEVEGLEFVFQVPTGACRGQRR